MKIAIEVIHPGRYKIEIYSDHGSLLQGYDCGSAGIMVTLTNLIFREEHKLYQRDQKTSSDQLAEEAITKMIADPTINPGRFLLSTSGPEPTRAIDDPMTLEEAKERIAEIDHKFESAKGWGSWMVELANEREYLATKFDLPQRYNARTAGGHPVS